MKNISELNVREMLYCDINTITEIHLKAFQGFFLEKMGPMFLRNYYKHTLSYQHTIALVIEGSDKEIMGFCVGYKYPNNFYKYFKKNSFKFIPSILVGLIKNPTILIDIIKNVFRVNNYSNEASNIDKFELASIGVKNNKKGIGSILIKEFISEVNAVDKVDIVLTTDKYNNDKVHIFYQKHGFMPSKDITRGQRVLTEYILKK